MSTIKQILVLLQIILASNTIAYCQSSRLDKGIELIDDLMFESGVGLRDTLPSTIYTIDNFHPFSDDPNLNFNWMLCQWSSKYNLKGSYPDIKENNTFTYADSSKSFSICRLTNSVEIGLALNASKEYLHPRKNGEFWPHLLLEQNIENRFWLSDFNEISFSIEAKLSYIKNQMTSKEFNSNLHTALFVAYLVIANMDSTSDGYQDFFYFGINMFDYRHREIPFYAAMDFGKNDATGKFIYCPPANEIYEGSFHSQDWININKDIYPFLKKAYELAKLRNFLKHTSFDDLQIIGFNIGWEMTGTFDGNMIFRNLSLQGK